MQKICDVRSGHCWLLDGEGLVSFLVNVLRTEAL